MIDIASRQYILTAKHLVRKAITPLSILWEGGWQPLPVKLVGHCKGETDISVLSTNQNLPMMLYPKGNNLDVEPDLKLSEDIRFYGFPHGLSTSRGKDSVPVALVKQGIVSGFFGEPLGSSAESFYIDGHNNPGFSGGPVVTIRNGEYKVAGVVSGRKRSYQKVYGIDSLGQPDKSIATGYFPENTGIVMAHNIKPALDLILERPIGLSIPEAH